MEQLTKGFAKSSKQSINPLAKWLADYYGLAQNYSTSAVLMAQGEGIKPFSSADNSKDKQYSWLRADPVMLSVTHNGILCRGNRVLNLSSQERVSLELLINDYLKEQSIELLLSNSNYGYIKLKQPVDCQFSSLSEVIGQDISHRLPKGNNASFWHKLLIDLQMLLHNCEVNLERESKGLPTVNGFWLWANEPAGMSQGKAISVSSKLYTDDTSLAGALGDRVNSQQLGGKFELGICDKDETIIYISEFEDAFHQNDMEGWLDLYQQWVEGWLMPACEAVSNKQLQRLVLIPGDGFKYSLHRHSPWCFWRNHLFKEESL